MPAGPKAEQKADRVRLGLDKKPTSRPACPPPSSGTSVDATT